MLNKLKGKITECEKTYRECADFLGISISTFNNKINGIRKFYIDELDRLGDFLGMSKAEKAEIFLS